MERTHDEENYKIINLLLRKKTRSESSEYMRKTTGFFTNSWRNKIALESYFEEHSQEIWERNWMNPEMQTTLWNTYLPKLIATILKALREQLKENAQLNADEEIAGPAPEGPLEYDEILKDGGQFWMTSTVDIFQKILCWLRDDAGVQRCRRFQDGSRKEETQTHHGSGRVHLHAMLLLDGEHRARQFHLRHCIRRYAQSVRAKGPKRTGIATASERCARSRRRSRLRQARSSCSTPPRTPRSGGGRTFPTSWTASHATRMCS